MNKKYWGLILGFIAGIIDVIPMIIKKLTWDANLSAFFFWIVAGFVISSTDLKLKGTVKGIFLSLILILPLTFIIAWQDPISLLPIIIMNIILGGSLGYLLERIKIK